MPAERKLARDTARQIELPPRPFLYTPDQIAGFLAVPVQRVYDEYLFYSGTDSGRPGSRQMVARNISANEERPEWRVSEEQLKRWAKRVGFRVYERTWL